MFTWKIAIFKCYDRMLHRGNQGSPGGNPNSNEGAKDESQRNWSCDMWISSGGRGRKEPSRQRKQLMQRPEMKERLGMGF